MGNLKFNPGDKVICINNTSVERYLTEGAIYIVAEFTYSTKEIFVTSCNFSSFFADRFRLASRFLDSDWQV